MNFISSHRSAVGCIFQRSALISLTVGTRDTERMNAERSKIRHTAERCDEEGKAGMYRRRTGSEDEVSARPTIISLADVALCLLVIVLATGGAATQLVEVALPHAANTASRDINLAVTLTVARDGTYYFEDEKTPIAAKNLWTALREIKGANVWTMAVVRGDKGASWEHVSILTQCLQGLGVDEISYQMKEAGD